MNKERRGVLYTAIENLNTVQNLLSEISDIVSEMAEEEREFADNMPENLQGSERYERANEVSDILDNIVGDLENYYNDVGDTISSLEECVE